MWMLRYIFKIEVNLMLVWMFFDVVNRKKNVFIIVKFLWVSFKKCLEFLIRKVIYGRFYGKGMGLLMGFFIK